MNPEVMTCKHNKKLLPLFLDGGLSEIEKNEVQSHLDNCNSCLKEYNDLLEQEIIIKRIHSMIPSTQLWEKIKKHIKTKNNIKRKLPIPYIILSAVLFFISFLLYIFLKNYKIDITRKHNSSSAVEIANERLLNEVKIIPVNNKR